MKSINWKTTKNEIELISSIVTRAHELALTNDVMSLNMDITATHLNGNTLDLDKLLSADNFNFSHDIVGIMNTINRRNGRLTNCFVPRCSI